MIQACHLKKRSPQICHWDSHTNSVLHKMDTVSFATIRPDYMNNPHICKKSEHYTYKDYKAEIPTPSQAHLPISNPSHNHPPNLNAPLIIDMSTPCSSTKPVEHSWTESLKYRPCAVFHVFFGKWDASRYLQVGIWQPHPVRRSGSTWDSACGAADGRAWQSEREKPIGSEWISETLVDLVKETMLDPIRLSKSKSNRSASAHSQDTRKSPMQKGGDFNM